MPLYANLNMHKYAQNMHEYAKICSDPISISPMHSCGSCPWPVPGASPGIIVRLVGGHYALHHRHGPSHTRLG